MNNKNLLAVFLLAAGACGVSLAPAQAQPDVNNAPKAANPPNWNPGGGGRRGGGQRLPLTVEQLRQLRARQVEMRALSIREQLTMAGYTEEPVQTAVVDYYKAQNEAQTTLLEQWQKIAQAVQVKATPETQMATMLNDFRASVDKEKERRETAYKTLSTTLELPKKPMLDALLMTMGLAGDEASFVGQGAGGMGGLMNLLGNMRIGGPGGMGNVLGGAGAGAAGNVFALPGVMGGFAIRRGVGDAPAPQTVPGPAQRLNPDIF